MTVGTNILLATVLLASLTGSLRAAPDNTLGMALMSAVVSGDNARQENRQKIHVVNGRSISLDHVEVKSPNRGRKARLVDCQSSL